MKNIWVSGVCQSHSLGTDFESWWQQLLGNWDELKPEMAQSLPQMQKYSSSQIFWNAFTAVPRTNGGSSPAPESAHLLPHPQEHAASRHVLSLRDSPLLPLSLWDRGKKTSRTAHADVGQESASLSRGSCVWGNTYRPWVLHQNLLGCYGSVIHVNQIWSRINMREEGF